MNVAVVGSSGYIAGFLLTELDKKTDIDKLVKIDQNDDADNYLNLQEPEKFDYDVLEDIDYVIFTAAVSGPDQCALDIRLCWKINVTGTRYFIDKAIKKKCRVLFFSSDAVFGNIAGEVYDEESETKAETPYGCMKKAIEDAFKCDADFKAVRLSYVVSAKDKFISYCLSCIRNKEVANVFHPFYRNAIVISDVVRIVVWLIQHWNEYKPSVLNAAGEELVSRVRMADELNWHLGNKLQYVISAPEHGFYKNRPAITQMKSLYIQQYKIIENATFTEKIKKELIDTDVLRSGYGG